MNSRQCRALQVDSVKQGTVIGCLMCVGVGLLGMSFAGWPLLIDSPFFLWTLILSIIGVCWRRNLGGNVLVAFSLAVSFCGCTQSAGGPPAPSNSVDQRPGIDDHKVKTDPTEIAQTRTDVVQPSTEPKSVPVEQRPVSNPTISAKSRPPVVIPDAPDMRRPPDSKIETRTHWDDAGRYFFEYPAQWQVVEGQDQVVLTSVPNSECSVSVDFHSPGRGIAPADYGFKDTAAGVCQVYMRDAAKNGRPTRGPLELKIPGADDAAWAAWEWNESITELVIFRVNGDYKKLELHYLAAASPIRTQAVTPLQTLRIKNRNKQVALDPATRNPPQTAQSVPQSGAAEEGYVAPSPSFSKRPPSTASGAVGNPQTLSNSRILRAQQELGSNAQPEKTSAPTAPGPSAALASPSQPQSVIGAVLSDSTPRQRVAGGSRGSVFAERGLVAMEPNERDGRELALLALTNKMVLPAEPPQNGVRIDSVIGGSPADDAGLWGGAVITKADGRIVASVVDDVGRWGGSRIVKSRGKEDDVRLLYGAVITKIDGRIVTSISDVQQIIGRKSPGDEVVLKLQAKWDASFCQAELDCRRMEWGNWMLPHPTERIASPRGEIRVKVAAINTKFLTTRTEQEKDALDEVNDRDGSMIEDVQRPRTPVIAVQFQGSRLSDGCFQHLRGLRDVTTFRIENGFPHDKFTGTGLSELAHLPRLRTLHLVGGRVDEAWLKVIGDFEHLTVLSLEGCKLTPEAMAELGKLTRLRTLSLRSTAVTDEQFKSVANLTQLQAIDLVGTKITVAGLVHLKSLVELECLNLSRIPVTDESAKNLSVLTKLRFLNLSNNRLTDQGLSHLSNLKMLQSLELDYATADNGPNGRPAEITLGGLLQHFGQISFLERLSVRGPEFEPSEVRQLAKLWPKAEIITSRKTISPTSADSPP